MALTDILGSAAIVVKGCVQAHQNKCVFLLLAGFLDVGLMSVEKGDFKNQKERRFQWAVDGCLT